MKTKQNLIEILKRNDVQGIPFAQTKKELLMLGYSEAEISHALFEVPYDGRPNAEVKPDPVTKHFTENPAAADKVAKTLLKDLADRERDETVAYGLASRLAPGRHAQSFFEFEFFEELGLPWFSIFFVTLLLFIAVIKFNLPVIVPGIFGGLVVVWVGVKLWHVLRTRD